LCGLAIVILVLLVGLLLQWRSYSSDMSILKRLRKTNKSLFTENVINMARTVNNGKPYVAINLKEGGRQTRF